MSLLPKKNNNQIPQSNSGQALLLILLSMSVILVVALSIVSRSITDISTTSKEEASTRAFNAAESGVERVLVTGAATGSQPLGDANFNATVTSVGRAVGSFSYPAGLVGGDSAAVWLASRNANGAVDCSGSNICFTGNSVNVCWGNTGTAAGTATTPALEFIYYYDSTVPGDYTNTRAQRAVFDPNVARTATNDFDSPDAGTCTIGTKVYPFHKNIGLASGGNNNLGNTITGTAGSSILFKVKLLYNTAPHDFGIIAASSTFPAQGNLIDSRGTSGDSNRRLNVFQSIGDVPPIFDNVVYSEGSLSK